MNNAAQLGDGTLTDSNVPVQVTGPTSNVTAISAGREHTCVVLGGAAKCWGNNDWGRLGDGTTTSSSAPVQVSGLTSNVTAISAGGYQGCGVIGGAAKCWGYNSDSQLGWDAGILGSTTPGDVTGLTSNVTAISVGEYHSCAILEGAVTCWGYNVFGQLGRGTITNSISPANVIGLDTAFAPPTTTTTATTTTTTAPTTTAAPVTTTTPATTAAPAPPNRPDP